MYNVFFYVDKNGKEPVRDCMKELASKNDKDSKIKFNKLVEYIDRLSQFGLSMSEPHIKHIDGDIWELRPSGGRVFFVAWYNGSFVLLHYFVKKTQKTPKRELERAKKELEDMKERRLFYD